MIQVHINTKQQFNHTYNVQYIKTCTYLYFTVIPYLIIARLGWVRVSESKNVSPISHPYPISNALADSTRGWYHPWASGRWWLYGPNCTPSVIPSAYAVRMQCVCSAYAVRMQCICSAYAVCMQCICSSYVRTWLPCVYFIENTRHRFLIYSVNFRSYLDMY